MTIVTLAVFLLVPLAFIGLAITARTASGPVATVSRYLTTAASLPMLCFFPFGFLASFEGNDASFWIARVVYVVLFLAVLATLGFVWLPGKKVVAANDAGE